MGNIKYNCAYYKLTIIDSYSIRHAEYHNYLNRIKEEIPNSPIWKNRTMWSIECEWAVHNLCYKLGINREKTKDADFEFVQSKKAHLFYNILGSLLYIWK